MWGYKEAAGQSWHCLPTLPTPLNALALPLLLIILVLLGLVESIAHVIFYVIILSCQKQVFLLGNGLRTSFVPVPIWAMWLSPTTI